MKLWKKTVLTGAVLFSSALALAACGGGSGEGEAKTKSKDGSDTEVTKVIWYQVGEEPKDFDQVLTEVNKKMKDDIGLELDMRLIPDGDYQQKMGVMINSGEEYDIAFINGSDYVNYGNKGAFIDLTPHLDKELKEATDRLNDGFVKGASMGENLFAFPVNNALATTEYWVFNKELVDKYDLDVENVQSLQDLGPVLEAFTEKNDDPSITPIGMTSTSVYAPYDFINGQTLGVPFEGDVKEIVNVYDSKDMKENMKTMHDYYQKGYILKDAATITSNPFPLEGGNWLVKRESGGDETSIKNALEGLSKRELILKPLNKAYKTTGFARVGMHAISAASKRQAESLKLLNYVNTNKEVADLLVYGIEGQHYDRNDDDSITMTNTKDYYQGAWALLDCYLISSTTPKTEDFEKNAEIAKAFQDESPESPILGFSFDSSNFRTQMASINSILDQYLPSLKTGTMDPEKVLPEMLEKIEQAGNQEMKEEAQRQYDEWLSKK
ncbi:ABC transporter substrate-binding protein [Enterococcus alcedinis]|uniref:ABC transporter substrate-binding protein n=1 Tax=Enterococcus alcedinis TaxID=1274384 RepID=A0A917N4D3_9ENTE|nr:ABC transporter substrate-binding protein [Enterococcus alcedinis]MBP2101782.1 putative aldouronate transport system substrate-binding protein [Enterococcus alcedinis]GGI65346.1 ABC transporter substrate-binding protein [Enterococcus alcedinis]